jgi:hypothetical protein
MNAVVLRRTTIGYINFKPAGRFYEARRVALDVVIGAFASAHKARQAILADHRARQAELQRKRPRHPIGTKPVFRGERMIGWISAGSGRFDAFLTDGEILGPFAAEPIARKAINSAWGTSRSKVPPVYGMAARRRHELVRLARRRNEQGQEIQAHAMALVMADCLVFALHGADFASLSELARGCGLTLDEGVAMLAINKVTKVAERKGRLYRPFAGRAVARMLGVTLAEKKQLELRTIAAVDETREQAEQRRRAERREYERERNKRRRIERGAVPHEDSLSRTKPWTAAGISRSTWYARRKAAETAAIPALSEPQASVGQIRPPAIQGKGFASAPVQSVQQHGPRRDGQADQGQGYQGRAIADRGNVVELRPGQASSPSPHTARPTVSSSPSKIGPTAYAPLAAESESPLRTKLVEEPDLKRLHQLANRVRWEFGLTKLSRDDVLRLLENQAPALETEFGGDEEGLEERERDWLCAQYDRMDDQLLLDQIWHGEEVPSYVRLEELLDGGETPRRRQMRSRLIDYLVDRDLAA